jgi:zona occludens toxin
MITLYTGLPRSGKTHGFVEWLDALQKSWSGSNSGDTRPVYSNIKGLLLKHLPLPILDEVYDANGVLTYYAVDWPKIVDGAFVLIDECQDTFPPRAAGQKAPAHVACLNTHGHHGLDIGLITQHPKLIDNAVRRLVQLHKHFRKNTLKPALLWFLPDAITYSWDHCEDGLLSLKTAVMGSCRYSKRVFALYTSAVEHRRPVFDRPWWIWVPVILVPAGAYYAWASTDTLKGVMGGKVPTSQSKALAGPSRPSPALYTSVSPPALLSSAPLLPVIPGSTVPASVLIGCARVAELCKCYSSTMEVLDKLAAFCQEKTAVGSSVTEVLLRKYDDQADGELIAFGRKQSLSTRH